MLTEIQLENIRTYSREDREADFQFCSDHYDELLEKYGKNVILAIRKGQVLGMFNTYDQGFDMLREIYSGAFILHHFCENSDDHLIRTGRIKCKRLEYLPMGWSPHTPPEPNISPQVFV